MVHNKPPDILWWWLRKWQRRLVETNFDYRAVATQMRKQGVPFEITHYTLLGGR